MPQSPNRVAIERIDWAVVLPVLGLVRAFRLALQPDKLVVAFVAIAALHGFGLLVDATHQPKPKENQSKAVIGDNTLTAQQISKDPIGPYKALRSGEAHAFAMLIKSSLALDHGVGPGEPGVADALHAAVIGVPRVVYAMHPWRSVLLGAGLLVVFMLAGGVVCRMAATQACRDEVTPLPRALAFVGKRWLWYLLTPLMPAALLLLLGLVLMLAGLVFFNAPVLDIIGSIAYGPMLLLGFVIALVLLVLLFALFLMPPALSTEASDGFDAISRTFNYVLYKPWQLAGYVLGAAVMLAVVSVLVGTLLTLTVVSTDAFVGTGVFAETGSETKKTGDGQTSLEASWNHYDLITGRAPESEADGTLEISSWIVRRWIDVLIGLSAAVLFSVLCCLQTLVYIRMRYCADGTPLDECAEDEERDLWADDEPAETDSSDSQAQPDTHPGDEDESEGKSKPASPPEG